MISKLKKEEGWHFIDLHVHTPASKDYKGKRDRNEYKEIIMKMDSNYRVEEKEKITKIDLIAITDHNSVEGFKAIMEIRKETSELIKKLKERDPNLEYIKELQKEEELLNSVHILMGVETKPDPGIHILIIFHEEIKPEMVETFLSDGFGEEYEHIKGNPELMLKWNISQTFDEIQKRFGNKAFVIAPHIDSNCGLYESLKNLPQARMIALKHPILKAISFNNSETRDKIKKLFQSPDYKRNTPIVFLQDSDFHGESGSYIGSSNSKIFIGSKKLSYNSLLEALSIEKNVKCSVDFVEEIYKNLIEGFSVKRFISNNKDRLIFSESDYESLCNTVCAYLNSESGIIEIEGNISILDDKASIVNEFEKNLKDILASKLKPIPEKYSIKILQMSNTKFKFLVLFKKSSKLFMSNEKVLVLKNGNPCSAEPHEIEHIVARNLYKRYGESVEKKLEDLTLETKRISKIQRSYPVVVRYDNKLVKNLEKFFNFKLLKIHEKIELLEQHYKKYSNGVADGNIEVSVSPMPPRLPYSYLRYSAPSYNIPENIITEKNAILQAKSGLIIIPEGGVVLTIPNKHLHVAQPTIFLEMKGAEEVLPYLAWFKSSFFLWYCAIIIGELDLFVVILDNRKKIPLPNDKVMELLYKSTNNHIKNLLLDEKNFLKEYVKLIDKRDEDSVQKLIEKHNKSADSICRMIDIEVFKCLELNAKDALEIYNDLKYLGIYEFGVTENSEYKKNLEVLDKTT